MARAVDSPATVQPEGYNTVEQKGKNRFGNLLFLAVLIALTFYLLLKDLNMSCLWENITEANGWFLLGGFLMMLVFLCLEGQCYRVMLRSLGEPAPLWPSFAYACADFYVSSITPSATGGQPAVVYYMKKDGVSVAKGSIILLLYTVIYKAVLITLGIAAVVLYPSLITEGEWYFQALFIYGVVLNLIVMSLFVLAMYSNKMIERVGRWFIRSGSKIRLVRNPDAKMTALEAQLQDYRESALHVRQHPLLLLKVYGWAMLQRLAMFSVSFWVYCSMGHSSLSIVHLIAIQVLISLAVDSLPLPGAVGAAEKMFLTLYGSIYAAGELEPALLLTRGINYYGCLLLCGIICVIYHRQVMRRSAKLSRC